MMIEIDAKAIDTRTINSDFMDYQARRWR